MAGARDQMRYKTLDNLADELTNQDAGTPYHRAALAELKFREAEAQIKAADAQCKAAEATEATAKFTYWAVWVSAASALIAALSLASAVFFHLWR